MKEITSILYGSSGVTKKVVYSKNIQKDILLMSNCQFNDDKGMISIIELMCSSTDKNLIENSRSLDETFALTSCEEDFIDTDYVYYCLIEGSKLIWIPVNNNDKYIRLIDKEGSFYDINLPSEWGNQNYQNVKAIVTVTVSNKEVDNIGYLIHEIVDNPHRNLQESVLYEKEVDPLLIGDTILSEVNGCVTDRRSRLFLYKTLEEYDI